MTSYTKTLLILISVIIASCGHPPKEKWEISYDKQEQLDTLNKNEGNKLSLQQNAITLEFDTILS